MWELMNGMTNGLRNRMFPQKRGNGLGTMTAMLIGASVGIAAWEALRKTQPISRMTDSSNAVDIAKEVIDHLD